MKKLIRQSDVMVENFVAGKLASSGLGWEVGSYGFIHGLKSVFMQNYFSGLQENQPTFDLYVYNWSELMSPRPHLTHT